MASLTREGLWVHTCATSPLMKQLSSKGPSGGDGWLLQVSCDSAKRPSSNPPKSVRVPLALFRLIFILSATPPPPPPRPPVRCQNRAALPGRPRQEGCASWDGGGLFFRSGCHQLAADGEAVSHPNARSASLSLCREDKKRSVKLNIDNGDL